MTARGAVHTILANDAALPFNPGTLGNIGFTHVYGPNTADTPAEPRFICIKWDPTAAQFGTIGADRVLLWFHDKDRDYGAITNAIRRATALLTAAVHVAGTDGYTLAQANWRGDSADLFDPVFHTVTRWAAFDIAARPTT